MAPHLEDSCCHLPHQPSHFTVAAGAGPTVPLVALLRSTRSGVSTKQSILLNLVIILIPPDKAVCSHLVLLISNSMGPLIPVLHVKISQGSNPDLLLQLQNLVSQGHLHLEDSCCHLPHQPSH